MATFFTSQTGIFVSCLIVLAFVAIVVTMGMETYARIQKVCFWIGLGGLVVVCGLLLFASQSDFQAAFNREATSLFGAPGNAYQGTIDAASKSFGGSSFGTVAFGPLLLLLPWLAFYLLWPNWGATLYGEVRGAKDIRKPFWSMFWGLWVTVALVAVVVLLINKTIGWNFYQSANAAYWNNLFAVQGAVAPPVPIWPYPVMFAGFLVNNHLFQALLIIVMGLWFFGWAGTLFLSSTRVIFAAAFDRVLPAWAANISAKRRVPYGSLVLMILPSLVISAVYAYKPTFTSVFLDATAVLALTFFATVVAAIILPWRRKDLYEASPIPLQGRRRARDHDRRRDHRPLPAVHVVRVVVQQGQPVRHVVPVNSELGLLLPGHLHRRDHHLRGRADRPEPAGNRPAPDPPRDTG